MKTMKTIQELIRKIQDKIQKPIVLRKRRQRLKCYINWKMFQYQFARDHSKVGI